MSEYEAPYHVAPRAGQPTVFASVRYEQGKPPESITIGKDRWLLVPRLDTRAGD